MSDGSSSGPGCIWTVIGIFVLWALLFGLTIKHYGLSSPDKGVTVEKP